MKNRKQKFIGFISRLLNVDIQVSEKEKEISNPDEFEDKYIFDFKNYQSQYRGNGNGGIFINQGLITGGDSVDGPQDKVVQKITVKPKDVLEELETVPTPFNLVNLDDKVFVLKQKSDMIVQNYAKREIDALIERMENRKKYDENKTFFDRFANTTDEKIANLLKKYDLVMKTSDIFIPEFPTEAIDVMREYIKKVEKLFGKKPVFYVIAENSKFQEVWDKRDPILLVQSPFGFYWQILGAWDEEMLILSEL